MTSGAGSWADRLNVRIDGETGPWLVLCHGFGVDHRCWDTLAPKLAHARRVLRFDLSYLASAADDLHADVASYADDLLDLMEELEIENADLVGHSVGAMIVLAAAVAEPSRARRLILLNASARYLDDDDYTGGWTADGLAQLFETMRDDYRAWVLAFAPLATGQVLGGRGVSDFMDTLLALDPFTARSVLRSIFEMDFRPLLPSVTQKTYVVQGPRDVAVPIAATRYLVSSIPDATLITLDAEGHLPQLTAPDEVGAVIADLLSEGTG